MSDTKYTGYQYKLRTGSPMPKGMLAGGEFYVHTFMAEKTKVDIYTYTENLPSSKEFRGQLAGLTNRGESFISASFNRLKDKSGKVFSGTVTYNPVFIDEDDLDTSPGP